MSVDERASYKIAKNKKKMSETEYTYILDTDFSIYQTLGDVLVSRGYWKKVSKKSTRYNLLLGDRFQVNYGLAREGPAKLLNYYKGSHLLTLKSAMAKLLPRFPTVSWMPETYVLPLERELFVQACAGRKENSPMCWILKPSAGCKGEGIVISRDITKLMAVVEAAPPKASFVVQEYVARPMLINGRKFDIRQWVLLTPSYEVYVFSQGSLRTCSVPFTPWQPQDDPLAHLTNHCLQETGPHFGKFEPGNEMWYHQFEDYLRDSHNNGIKFRESILPAMENIVKRCFQESRELLEVPLSSSSSILCFQLFGFDFMLREDHSVVLIEINGSPASAEKWQRSLVEGIVKTVIDPYFPPPPGSAESGLTPQDETEAAYWYKIC